MSLSTTQYGYIVDPMVPFTDDKGKTIKNGFIRVFMAGTSTQVITYRNYDGATNQEKIELDNSGRVKHNVIGSKGSLYKVVVYDAHHSQETPILTVDKIAVLGASINASGATIVTGLDSVTVQEENFLKATVEGTGVELALDPTEVTSEISTISDAATAAPDYVLPLLDKTGTGDGKKISLANLFKFALDWISRLATTVTSFASGDFIAVSNTTNGARKMSKDTLLELTAQNALGYITHTFDGANTTLLTYSFSAIKGTSIKITPSTTSWNASAINASSSKFLVRAILADGTTRDDVSYLRDSTIPATISYIVQNDAVGVQICFRANTGESVDFTIENNGVNSIKDTMEKRQLYIPEGSLYIEETKVTNGKLWIKADGSLWTGRLQGTNINDTNAQFATRLGRTTETSAKGVTGCIPIDNLECLVATANGDYAIKTRDNLLPSDAVVLSCVGGALVQANTEMMAAFFEAYIRNGTIREQNFPRQIYGAERDNIYIEESKLNGGKVWIKVYDGLTVRLGTSQYYSNSQLATLFNKTLESSASGMPNCIPLSNLECIFLRNSELKCMNRTNLTNRDVLLLANVNGEVIGGNKELALKLSEITDKTYVYRNGIDAIYTKVADKIVGACDKFLFFTDPHCLSSVDKARRNFMWLVENVKNVQVPIDFTLSGGDWLSSGDSVTQAIEKLGIMTRICGKEFVNFKSLVGNHDTNYLGGERLSNDTLGSVMMSGKTYYSFKTANTRYFAFDTGVEEAVTPYEEEQIAWFASALLNNTDSHIGVLAHILTNDYGEGYDSSNFTLYYMASDLMDIAVAYNARTSVTKNGVTYDYSGVKTGYVEFFLGGHTHKDFGRLINNIPVVMTKNYGTYSDPVNNAVDLVIPNYTTKKLNLIRIGSGSDRNFDLFSASL